MNDPISDFLARIRNALMAGHDEVVIPFSTLKQDMARILKEEGYIDELSLESVPSPNRTSRLQVIRLQLKYLEDRESVITGLQRVSKPGRRRYVTADELPRVLGGMGTAILTTSRGLMTDKEARSQRVGGELLAYVW